MNTGFLNQADHRPWPMPDHRWVMRMRWHHLLFMHWPLEPAAIRERVPACLEVDCFEGHAWIGVVPFGMSDVALRSLPPFPGAGTFPEINVRTYVKVNGKPGVYFFSLDAASWLAVKMARVTFRLPYFHASIDQRNEAGSVRYRSRRWNPRNPKASFDARYGPSGPVYRSRPGNLDYWLTERYCLYTVDKAGRAFRGDIHHIPWPIQTAHATVKDNTMLAPLGLRVPDLPPLLHYAHQLDVVAWAIRPA
ncbi:MAG: hypothetical protein AMXMBFR84_06640 [Candidatus Hydrogenedentota bacterium]